MTAKELIPIDYNNYVYNEIQKSLRDEPTCFFDPRDGKLYDKEYDVFSLGIADTWYPVYNKLNEYDGYYDDKKFTTKEAAIKFWR